MSILSLMRQVEKKINAPSHPLVELGEPCKLSYLTGAILMALVDQPLNQLEKECLEKLAKSLQVNAAVFENSILTAKNPTVEAIEDIVGAFEHKEYQVLFLLDIYQIAASDGKLNQMEHEMLAMFGSMFGLTHTETQFAYEFAAAALEKDAHLASQVLNKALNHGLTLPIGMLEYCFPGFAYIGELQGFTIQNGQKRTLAFSFVLKSPIIVEPGGELEVHNANIVLEHQACIKVTGGKLKIHNSHITAGNNCAPVMVEASHIFGLDLRNVQIDGKDKVQGMILTGGTAKLYNCTFLNCKAKQDGAAIRVNDAQLHFHDCQFLNCQAGIKGGALFLDGFLKTRYILEGCRFQNCMAEKGGAIYLGEGDLEVNATDFLGCTAKGFGGGVFIKFTIGQEDGFETTLSPFTRKFIGWFKRSSKRVYAVGKARFEGCCFEKCAAYKGDGAISDGAAQAIVIKCMFEGCQPDDIYTFYETEIESGESILEEWRARKD